MEENKGLLLKKRDDLWFSHGNFLGDQIPVPLFSQSVPALTYLIYSAYILTVPFIAYYLTKRYKQDIGGKISFFHAWRFGTCFTFCRLDRRPRAFRVLPVYRSGRFSGNTVNQMIEVLKDSQVSTEVMEAIGKNQFHSYPYGYSGCFQ